MSAANTDKFIKATRKRAGNIDASGISDASVDNFGLDSAANLPTDTAVSVTIDRVDSNGNKTPDKEEEIIGVVSGNRIINAVRGVSGTAQAHSPGAVWEIRLTAEQWNRAIGGMLAEHDQSGAHDPALIAMLAGMQIFTGHKVFSGNLIGKLFAPQGFLINGKIVPSVTSNNLSVSLKTLSDNDPSSSDPVYCRIGDTVRAITSALTSEATVAGTNWFNAGSSELATKEIDYFAYLIWDSVEGAVHLSFSRIPYATTVNDFSGTATSEKVLPGHGGFLTTDNVELIGRFAATLSAGAGYTWSVPTFTSANLMQRPIYETRWLAWARVVTAGSGTPTTITNTECVYKISGDRICINSDNTISDKGTAASTFIISLPFASILSGQASFSGRENGSTGKAFVGYISSSSATATDYTGASLWTNGYRIPITGSYKI